MKVTQQELHEWFDYHPNGFLLWKKSPKYDIPIGSVAGSPTNTGYIEVGFKGQRYLLHRLIFLYHHGYVPRIVDHEDKDQSNNRKENLRPATRSLNAHNCDKVFGKVPYRGVSFCKKTGKYAAYLTHNGVRKFLGYFDDAVTASNRYKEVQSNLLRKEVV